MATLAAEVAAGTGFALFAYNRGNYNFDTSLRFERFTSAREFGCAQTGMYRKDVRKLAEMTTKKTTIWCITATLVMALNIALFCAGRLGLHGHSPPGWIQVLFLTNSAASFCWMGLTIWFAMTANQRAQTASVNLLTRRVRVPVPTLSQLDKARRLASEFEQQSWSDIFRVPYVMGAGVPSTDTMPGDISPRHAGGSKRKSEACSWVREEWQTDRAGTITGGLTPDDMPAAAARSDDALAPEHFNLFTAAQKEWWPYDAYSRVTLHFGFTSIIHGFGYYGLGHINIEARAFFAAYGCAFILMVLMALILRFDLVRGRNKATERLPNCEYLGPAAVLPAAIGMSLDFRVEFNESAVIICYLCQITAYIMQIIYHCRMLELALPDEWHSSMSPGEGKKDDEIGAMWWPDSWKLPSSFQHVLYLVAPPQKLAKGQNDIVREIKEGVGGVSMTKSPMSAEETNRHGEYLEKLLEWAMSDAIINKLSTGGQSQVRETSQNFQNARGKKNPSDEFAKTIKQSIDALDSIMTREGITPQGLTGSLGEESCPPTPRSQASSSSGNPPKAPTASSTSRQPPSRNLAHVEPWLMVALLIGSTIFAFALALCGLILEIFIGEQGLVTAPHWSRPPMTRASLHPHETGTPYGLSHEASSERWLPEQYAWHDEKRGTEVKTIGRGAGYPGIPRRMSGTSGSAWQVAPMSTLHESLQGIISAFQSQSSDQVPQLVSKPLDEKVLASMLAAERISWPAFFEPKLLVCGPGKDTSSRFVAALSQRGSSAIVSLTGEKAMVQAEPFRLAGISHLPPMVGASWSGPELGMDKEGLMMFSRAGHLMACPGKRPANGGRWACGPLAGVPNGPVPIGTRLAGAATAWLHGPAGVGGELSLHAAIVDESLPDLVALYMLEKNGAWLPMGEIPVPAASIAHQHVSLAFVNGGHLLVGAGNGALVQRRLADGAVLRAHESAALLGSAVTSATDTEWQAACGFHDASGGGLAHLVLRRGHTSGPGATWRPEIFTSPAQTAQ
jgi:hypothetical protein